MTVHELKCWPDYFRAVKREAKTFDLRLNDRHYRVGDTVILKEYDPMTKKYSGLVCRRSVSYVLRKFDGLLPGYVILGFGP